MKRQRGFTLLELLIAISIFAMIGLGSYQVLASVLQAQAMTGAASDTLGRMQRTYLRLSQDFRQILDRPVRDNYGETLPNLFVPERGYDLEFTRTGWRNPLRRPRSELQRVAFELEGEVLLRHYWSVLDRAQDSEPATQVVLEQVEYFRLRLLDAAGNWHTSWPPPQPALSASEATSGAPLPVAVELELGVDKLGDLRWVFEISGS